MMIRKEIWGASCSWQAASCMALYLQAEWKKIRLLIDLLATQMNHSMVWYDWFLQLYQLIMVSKKPLYSSLIFLNIKINISYLILLSTSYFWYKKPQPELEGAWLMLLTFILFLCRVQMVLKHFISIYPDLFMHMSKVGTVLCMYCGAVTLLGSLGQTPPHPNFSLNHQCKKGISMTFCCTVKGCVTHSECDQ